MSFAIISDEDTNMFVDNNMLCSTVMMSDIYNNYCEKNKNKDDFDGFLYVNITTENTFG